MWQPGFRDERQGNGIKGAKMSLAELPHPISTFLANAFSILIGIFLFFLLCLIRDELQVNGRKSTYVLEMMKSFHRKRKKGFKRQTGNRNRGMIFKLGKNQHPIFQLQFSSLIHRFYSFTHSWMNLELTSNKLKLKKSPTSNGRQLTSILGVVHI